MLHPVTVGSPGQVQYCSQFEDAHDFPVGFETLVEEEESRDHDPRADFHLERMGSNEAPGGC